MAYADSTFYKGAYGGTIIPDAELVQKLEKASDQIDSMTYNRIVAMGFSALSTFQQDRVKKAVCCHADFVAQYGDYISMPVSSYSAGSVSVSFNAVTAGGNVKTSEEVMNLLRGTGLTSRRL